ncbi:DMT family transporter [Gemmata sp. G18]|uniref:DMT family transporter n=1 Tax=Gemmata palustris TaxID=2822762 RepID=A0ABS5BNX7_9BACT|nr:DMT family transporter [Gemmata palustris]MBP3955010.1 DMT family transporter [Gemmata palustris]
MSVGTRSPSSARLCLILAAVLWSLGSVFMRLLREPLGLGLNDPLLTPLQIAFYRGLFGGLVMLALVRRTEMTFRPLMLGMVAAFAVMSGMYLSALDGPAANAIFLQNTAPVWVYLFAVLALGERSDRRGWLAVLLAALGAAVIVTGNWPRNESSDADGTQHNKQMLQLLLGLGSGVVYALVVLFLRALRAHSAAWLVAINLLGSAAALGLFVLLSDGSAAFIEWVTAPSARQIAVLVTFGAFQMAIPYWLFARGLRTVSPQEAALITLIEPLINPVWAYLITPHKDTPNEWMFLGGGLILLALVWRYLPVRMKNDFTAEHAENAELKQDKPRE